MNRAKPRLDHIRIASPCRAAWSEMVGDDRVRFCGHCEKNVYNISAMSPEDAAQLIAEKEGKLCLRMFRRSDGTVVHNDCPVGVRRRRVRTVVAAAAAVGGAALGAGLTSLGEGPRPHPLMGAIEMPRAEMTSPPTQPVRPPHVRTNEPATPPIEVKGELAPYDDGEFAMGDCIAEDQLCNGIAPPTERVPRL